MNEKRKRHNDEYIGNSLPSVTALRLRAAVAEQSVRESDQGNRKVLSGMQSLCKAEEYREMNEKRR